MVSIVPALLIICFHSAFASNIKEYVALGPNAFSGPTKLEWVAVEYAADVSSAKDVSLTTVKTRVPELGSWFGLDTGINTSGLALTAKIVDDTMYALYDKSGYNDGGCCADTLRIYKRSGGMVSIDLNPVVRKAMNSTAANATHTFDMIKLEDGSMAALFMVKYVESEIGGDYADAIVGMKVSDGSILRTADGGTAFNVFEAVGTMSTKQSESRFKIQFHKDSSSSGPSTQWHGNGVAQFISKAGIKYLAFTHRMDAEAVIFKCPFTYTGHEGGGGIVQRFGTPNLTTDDGVAASRRYFGLKKSASAFDTGVHNVFYTEASKSTSLGGKETISLFVNSQDSYSAAYEFVFNPVEEGSRVDPGDDSVFNVEYVFAKCSFTAPAQGGARTIGNGVFLVMSGMDPTGLEVVDTSGFSKSHAYSLGGKAKLYDPFIRVIAAPSTVVV